MIFTLSRNLISAQGIQPLPHKIMAITNLAELKIFDKLHHFLRLNCYCRRLVPLFTDVTKPHNKILRKNTKFQWSTQCQSAFEHLKNALCQKPILYYPDISKLFILFTDVSNYAYSCIITPVVDGPDDVRPIVYTSGFFLKCSRNGLQ